MTRADRNNNPTAMTTAFALEGGLEQGPDFEVGDPFRVGGVTYYTAMLVLGDPVPRTIQVIDKCGFYTVFGGQRWNYIAIPYKMWQQMTDDQKRATIGGMYAREGGTDLAQWFPVVYPLG